MATIIFFITYFFSYDETGEPIKQPKPRKLTIMERLISWLIGFIMLVLIIIILVLVLAVLGNQMEIAVINCINCTGLL